ncbi:MAG: (2Fe-2S) ferredoxin domain-containing protein [Calditrichaeota bacterium]|nr:MAG: (2Fe-2S) ferredoxin domain-containing protein [Calditrichota bacterium]MBL1206134.1 (2Fe-2S) ferredoxin domain-containing protein [Calditrichota bacterium]NOG45959.1 (2Fe-2S) ferredoxin domain-containing protein [Calditrichota bacterium]
MPNLKKHIFICENERPEDSPKGCCARKGGAQLKKVMKQKLAEKGIHKTYRANSAGCLDACEHGIAMVIYPQAIWYGHVQESDIDEIIEKTILKDEVIERLLIDPSTRSGR